MSNNAAKLFKGRIRVLQLALASNKAWASAVQALAIGGIDRRVTSSSISWR